MCATRTWARTTASPTGCTAASGRPADLGYYIGYHIKKAYYDRAPDKARAIREILHIADARQFLARSGYGARFK